MSNHRKILASIVAAWLLLMVVGLIVVEVREAFTSRANIKRTLDTARLTQKRAIERGTAAGRRMSEYQRQSLPHDPKQDRRKKHPNDRQIGRSLYLAWLSALIEKAQFADPKLTAPTQRTRNKNHQKLRFLVKTRATLTQLTSFLYDFYHADHLHQIRKLHVTPIAGSRDLDIDLTVEALILPEAKQTDRLSGRSSTRLLLGALSEYQRIIIRRNLFGPPNLSPVLRSISRQTAKVGQAVSLTAQASDGDRGDRLTYSLGPESAEGATIDPQSGLFRWTPSPAQGPGEYQAQVVVTDSGFPPQSDSGNVTITVVPFGLKLSAISDQTAQPGKEFSFTVPLSESDPSAKVRYELGDDAPPGAKLDRSTGQFRWTPGSYDKGRSVSVAVHVADDNTPERHDSTTFKIAVASPKPQTLQLDFVAQNTFLTAIVQVGGEPEAWLVVRPQGITIRVRAEQTFTAGNLSATVVRITGGEIVLRIGDQLVSIASGKSFADAVFL